MFGLIVATAAEIATGELSMVASMLTQSAGLCDATLAAKV